MTVQAVTRQIGGDILSVRADFSQAADPLLYNWPGGICPDMWGATVFQVADARHDTRNALDLVADWLGIGP